MNKLNNLIMILPIILNLLMIFIMMMPMKINKFHPIFLMMNLIYLTFLISLKMNFMNKNIIPFMLFLIMIGGLMIIFIYITSLSNNELFQFKYKIIFMNLLKIFPILLFMMIMLFTFYQLMLNYSLEMFYFNKFINFNNFSMCMMYKKNMNKSSYFLMIYLYFSMICIMNICYKMKIPLRQIYHYE